MYLIIVCVFKITVKYVQYIQILQEVLYWGVRVSYVSLGPSAIPIFLSFFSSIKLYLSLQVRHAFEGQTHQRNGGEVLFFGHVTPSGFTDLPARPEDWGHGAELPGKPVIWGLFTQARRCGPETCLW